MKEFGTLGKIGKFSVSTKNVVDILFCQGKRAWRGNQVALHERAPLEVVHGPGVPRVRRQPLKRRRDEGRQQALHQRLAESSRSKAEE